MRKTAGQLFAGHFHLPAADGTPNVELKHLKEGRKLGFPEVLKAYPGVEKYKTYIKVMTNARTPALS